MRARLITLCSSLLAITPKYMPKGRPATLLTLAIHPIVLQTALAGLVQLMFMWAKMRILKHGVALGTEYPYQPLETERLPQTT